MTADEKAEQERREHFKAKKVSPRPEDHPEQHPFTRVLIQSRPYPVYARWCPHCGAIMPSKGEMLLPSISQETRP